MTITFSNFSGTRSMNCRSAAAVLYAWMRHYNFPEAARDLIPPSSPSWTDDDPSWVVEAAVMTETETAAQQMIGHLFGGGFSYLSGKDAKGLAKFLRETADTRDGKLPGTMDDWTPPHDELQSATFLRELADFFDSSDFGAFATNIQVSQEGELEAVVAEHPSEELRLSVAIDDSTATVEVGR